MNKLFVLGTNDPDPSNWKACDEVELVIAGTDKEALELGEYPTDVFPPYPSAEVDMSKAKYVFRTPSFEGN
jgi:hypothetical protein